MNLSPFLGAFLLMLHLMNAAHHEDRRLDPQALGSHFGNQFGGNSQPASQPQQPPPGPPRQQQPTMFPMHFRQAPFTRPNQVMTPNQKNKMIPLMVEGSRPQFMPAMEDVHDHGHDHNQGNNRFLSVMEDDMSMMEAKHPHLALERSSCVVDPKLTVSFNRGRYLLSWLLRSGMDGQKTWDEAKAFCKRNCMNLIHLDSPQTTNFFGMAAKKADVYGFWTGAFFDGSSWKWVDDKSEVMQSVFSRTGYQGISQPDNHVGKVSGGLTSEECAAVLNNWYNDGPSSGLQDLVCQDRLPFICQAP